MSKKKDKTNFIDVISGANGNSIFFSSDEPIVDNINGGAIWIKKVGSEIIGNKFCSWEIKSYKRENGEWVEGGMDFNFSSFGHRNGL